MELSDWFKGFEKGIAKLTAEQREQFFSECGKHCVQCGTLQVYKELYEKANGDMDVFFSEASCMKRRMETWTFFSLKPMNCPA